MKISAKHQSILNTLTAASFENGFKAAPTKEMDNFLFTVKSDYMLGQLSTKLNVIKSNGLFFAVDTTGAVLFDVAMTESFEIVRMKMSVYNEISKL
jgi:hypothetical protein